MLRRLRTVLGLGLAGAIVATCALAFPAASRADPPTFTFVPANILVEASDANGAAVAFQMPTASDDNGDPYVSCDAAPGDVFPVGTTTVGCTAEDSVSGESSSASFSVRVLAHAQEHASSGSVRALFYYSKSNDVLTPFKNLRLTIIRSGQIVYSAAVPRFPAFSYPALPAGYGQKRSLFVRDLDGDGEPEVMLDLFWGGAHCCFWTDVFRYAASSYQQSQHFFGDLYYRLADPNHDGRPEFLSGDDRFAYVFSDFADSFFPLQVWSYNAGRFSDVTRRYPALIRKDAATTWRYYLSYRRGGQRETEGALAAWAGDQYLLQHRALVWKRILPLARAGRMKGNYPPRVFVARLKLFLRRHGYH